MKFNDRKKIRGGGFDSKNRHSSVPKEHITLPKMESPGNLMVKYSILKPVETNVTSIKPA
jgi:hypothetical protein